MGPISRYAKTLAASIPFIIAALKVLSDALGDGTVSNQEWIGTAIALLGALTVYAVPNKPPAGQPADPGMSEQDPAVTALSHLDEDGYPPENFRG